MSISSEDGLSQSQRSLAAPPCDRLKLIDFGLAKELGLYADRIPITMCGTLEFMSPEVMKCSHASPASDMWSVGVVLYMMLSGGVSPFWAGSEYRTQRKIVRGIYDLEHPNFKQVGSSFQARANIFDSFGQFLGTRSELKDELVKYAMSTSWVQTS